ELGMDAYGVDLSAELLAQAGELPGGAALSGRLVRADARAVPFASATFDGLFNLFSSFGYFGPQGDLEVLDEIGRLLRPGGRALLDLMNPPLVRSNLVPHSTAERNGARILESRVLRQGGRLVTKDVSFSLPSGEERRWREEVRLYETRELAELLAPRGLEITDVDGDFSGAPYDERAERQIVRLRRR
ncbi:MAG: class I SAM-dependent methyltransferase, partial [Longimicrobiales bacterium]